MGDCGGNAAKRNGVHIVVAAARLAQTVANSKTRGF